METNKENEFVSIPDKELKEQKMENEPKVEVNIPFYPSTDEDYYDMNTNTMRPFGAWSQFE